MRAANRPVQFPNEPDYDLLPNVIITGQNGAAVAPARGCTVNLKKPQDR